MVRTRGAAVLIATGLAAAACSSSSSAPLAVPPTTASVSPTVPTPTASAATGPESLVVTAAELGAGWQQKVIPGGDQVAGQVSLDLCGGSYASEALRIARLQVALKDGPVQLSNEVVEYTGSGATEAYQELKRRISDCPNTPVAMPEQGAPRIRFKIVPVPTRPGWAPMTVAVRATESAEGRTETGIAIYQFAGDWMSALYSYDTSASTQAALARAATIAAQNLRTHASSGVAA